MGAIYRNIVQSEKGFAHMLLLLIRLYWGWMFCVAGISKFQYLYDIACYFYSIGLPWPVFFAVVVPFFEIVGGLSLFFGIFTRVFTVPLVVIMISALLTAHMEATRQFFTTPTLVFSQAPFFYLYAALIVMIFGPGRFSADHAIGCEDK